MWQILYSMRDILMTILAALYLESDYYPQQKRRSTTLDIENLNLEDTQDCTSCHHLLRNRLLGLSQLHMRPVKAHLDRWYDFPGWKLCYRRWIVGWMHMLLQ